MSAPTLLRLATAGSVDDGKSTLIGRLLHDTKSVLADQLASVEAASRQRGWKGELADLALLTDGLRAEREQGITIDVAYRYFATARRSFVLADTPGHVQYTRNTVTGASTADAVVILVDARNGVVEQTLRHLAVVALLRVPHVLIALNKIDLVEEPAAVAQSVSTRLQQAAAALGMATPQIVPVSALHGDNVVERSARTPWYDGPTLLELLEDLPVNADSRERPFRMPVQMVIRPQYGAVDEAHLEYRGYAGRISSGALRIGDEVEIAPSGQRSRVVGIDLGNHPLTSAEVGRSVTVRLEDNIDVSRGSWLMAADTAPDPVEETSAVLAWLADSTVTAGARVLIKHGTRTIPARVSQIRELLDITDLTVHPADAGQLNDLVAVDLLLSEPLPLEPYPVNREGGAFLVLDPHSGTTLAAGLVGASLRA